MKKVLFVATVVKKHICQFHTPYMRWFQEQGYEVHVCASDDFEKQDVHTVPYCDRFYPVCFSRRPFSPFNLLACRRLKRVIDENHYALIHCHTAVAAALTRIAARSARQKCGTVVLYTAHGFHFYEGAPAAADVYRKVEAALVRDTDGLITINREDYAAARRFCASTSCRPWYIHGVGADTERIVRAQVDRAAFRKSLGIPQDAFVLLSVSEINRNKDLKTTLEAFAQAGLHNARYLICGSGDQSAACRALAAKRGISDQVIFAGYRYDIGRMMKISDAFLFPSHREGLGVAAIEAMAAGLPVIASNIRGVREYAVNLRNSILLPPGDVPGFADAMRMLAGNPELRARLGTHARLSVSPFELKNAAREMESIYRFYLGDGIETLDGGMEAVEAAAAP